MLDRRLTTLEFHELLDQGDSFWPGDLGPGATIELADNYLVLYEERETP